MVRGWIARRLARALLLEGGCRREFDGASGTWQYAWPWRPALSKTACTADTIVCTRNWRVSQGVAVHGESGGWGEEAFRSWYPPALLKNETLPSPRAALRRLQGERQIREAHLALANSLLDEQKGQYWSDKRSTQKYGDAKNVFPDKSVVALRIRIFYVLSTSSIHRHSAKRD